MTSRHTTPIGRSPADGPDPMAPTSCRVRRVLRETADTATLELEPTDGGPKPGFAPGQFNMIYAFGIGEVPISMSGDPTADGPWVHTIRAVGPTTRALCDMNPGGIAGVRGPYGSAWPVESAEGSDVIVMAGGIGLAPLRPAVYQILARRGRYGRVALLYGARAPAELLYVEELRRWRGRFDLEVEVTVDHATGDWRGHVGLVTTLLDYAPFDPDETVAFVCGPEIMIRHSAIEIRNRGVEAGRIHVSLERNMKCGIGFCGHCQLGPEFVCTDGPVFPLSRVERLLHIREV